MESTLRTVIDAERCAHRRPVGASRQLHEASGELIRAIQRLLRAARDLAAINECLARDPENGGVPPGLVQATAYCAYAQALLARTADEVFGLHREVLDGLETGTLVPEREPGRRPRIVLAPRSAPLRAFLRLRQPRVIERIGPLLQRRRRTPRPRALRVPRRSALGRAPPRFSVCSL